MGSLRSLGGGEIKEYTKMLSDARSTALSRLSQAVIIKTKIDSDKLNNNTVTALNRIFLEAKWLYNYIINDYFAEIILNYLKKENMDIAIKYGHNTGIAMINVEASGRTLLYQCLHCL